MQNWLKQGLAHITEIPALLASVTADPGDMSLGSRLCPFLGSAILHVVLLTRKQFEIPGLPLPTFKVNKKSFLCFHISRQELFISLPLSKPQPILNPSW